MKIWIVHNSTYGNGKKVAETLGKIFEKDMDVKVDHIKNISPEKVAQDLPDAIIVGTFVRTFMLNANSKKWLRKLKSSLKESNTSIKFGVSFMTHALGKDTAKFWGKRFNKSLMKGNTITNVYPEWLSAQVAAAEGPLKDGVIEEISNKGKELLDWMKK
ncbi:MAG TPA: flavodoxin domain-containing protein [candidate division Zixibacteria bacterium]|nr:flavodoxin domain-containing protein [candidate division Zixibacteria bacterium]